VECFEKIFFNVRDRLDASTWVLKTIGASPGARRPLAPDGALTAKHIYTTWQTFAYYGGPLVLERVLGALPRAATAPTNAQVAAWLDEATTEGVSVRAAVAAFWLAEMSPDAVQLLKLHARLMTSAETPIADPPGFPKANMEAFLKGMESFRDSAAGESSDDEPKPPA
jgi:hypothetical protein